MPALPHNSASSTPRWQQELADAIRDPAELLNLLQLDTALLPAARAAGEQFRCACRAASSSACV